MPKPRIRAHCHEGRATAWTVHRPDGWRLYVTDRDCTDRAAMWRLVLRWLAGGPSPIGIGAHG